ncbi:MAG: polysaccharide deacetylase family protein [Gammaproteobacteria bacterium]|nr:polysaccharide deacetylase family protein [Gammaproteobacteria bacterium]
MSNRFLILMYHMISEPLSKDEDKYACPPSLFDKHMASLRSSGFIPVSLEAIEQHLKHQSPLPEKAVAVTLDDGFEDNFTNALPILVKHRIPATVFLATGSIDGYNQWMTRRNFPSRKMLNWQQVTAMDQEGIAFGAHTVTHCKLPELDKETVSYEISASKQQIEDRLGKPCRHFAYPYGLFTTDSRNAVENAGFSLACSTRSGFNTRHKDPFLLHRIEVYGNDACWKLKQKMTFGINNADLFFPLKYYCSRLAQRFTRK